MNWRSPLRVPEWVPRVPGWVSVTYGLAVAAWAGWKLHSAPPLMQCGHDKVTWAYLSMWADLAELTIGICTAYPGPRRKAALAGFAMNLGLVLFAFVAHVRDLEWKGCGCLFGGIDAPWLPWHAVVAAGLAIPFAWIFVDAERRFLVERTRTVS